MKAGLAILLAGLLAGCGDATPSPMPECHLPDFLGDWVNTRRADEGVSVSAKAVTMLAGPHRTEITYVANRDFGPVTRQVLRQEFTNLAELRTLPPAPRGLGEMVCAIHLIRPHGAAALVASGRRELYFLEETDGADPPDAILLRRGKPRPLPGPDINRAPT